ncbi:hypothetical protein CQA40_05880 [Helicobacter sp. MIT 01-3238]|nr:hypothetical protein CQA40_05880 [Helicobacter sp. MIT 01-3238]
MKRVSQISKKASIKTRKNRIKNILRRVIFGGSVVFGVFSVLEVWIATQVLRLARNDEKCCHIEVSQETEISKRILHSLHFLSYLSASEISFLQCKLSYLRAFNHKVSQKSTHPLYPPPQRRGNSQNYHLQRRGNIWGFALKYDK